MKIVKNGISNFAGKLKLICQDYQDFYLIYNTLSKGDLLTASCLRQVSTETATGSTQKQSRFITITIRVESLFYDTQVSTLRVNGRNTTESKLIKLGQYHTLDLELNRPFTIEKEWDQYTLDLITSNCDVKTKAQVAAIVLESGLAHICLLTDYLTVCKQRIELVIPKKQKYSTSEHDKKVVKFYTLCLQGLKQHVDFSMVNVVLIASPGFYKDGLLSFIREQSVKSGDKLMLDNLYLLFKRSKIIPCHSSSGQLQALAQIMQDPAIKSRLIDCKFIQQQQLVDRFYKELNLDLSKAFYGYNYCKYAVSSNNCEILMVTDTLLRSDSRILYLELINECKQRGGEAVVFSGMHNSGKQLDLLTGVACILYYGMPELEEIVQQTE